MRGSTASTREFVTETPRDCDPQGTLQPGAPPAQLYNLRDDLSQTTNHFCDRPDTAKRVAARLEERLPKPKRPGKQ